VFVAQITSNRLVFATVLMKHTVATEKSNCKIGSNNAIHKGSLCSPACPLQRHRMPKLRCCVTNEAMQRVGCSHFGGVILCASRFSRNVCRHGCRPLLPDWPSTYPTAGHWSGLLHCSL